MQNELIEQARRQMDRSRRRDDLTLFAIAAGMAVVHIATNGRYGFHRDELQTLSDALHMDWGFVAYPHLRLLSSGSGWLCSGLR